MALIKTAREPRKLKKLSITFASHGNPIKANVGTAVAKNKKTTSTRF